MHPFDDPFAPELEEQHLEIKGVSLSLEEIDAMQHGARLICEQYGNGYSNWDQVLTAVTLYTRLETLKQYAKPV